MDDQNELHEELMKPRGRDIAGSWVSSSGFLFYLQVACIAAAVLGGCYMLYTKRYQKANVPVQASTLYIPVYK